MFSRMSLTFYVNKCDFKSLFYFTFVIIFVKVGPLKQKQPAEKSKTKKPRKKTNVKLHLSSPNGKMQQSNGYQTQSISKPTIYQRWKFQAIRNPLVFTLTRRIILTPSVVCGLVWPLKMGIRHWVPSAGIVHLGPPENVER